MNTYRTQRYRESLTLRLVQSTPMARVLITRHAWACRISATRQTLSYPRLNQAELRVSVHSRPDLTKLRFNGGRKYWVIACGSIVSSKFTISGE